MVAHISVGIQDLCYFWKRTLVHYFHGGARKVYVTTWSIYNIGCDLLAPGLVGCAVGLNILDEVDMRSMYPSQKPGQMICSRLSYNFLVL
jgi:hypothetical protein